MSKLKFRKGQELVCIHYKDKPVVVVDDIFVMNETEVWVKDSKRQTWWGPQSWFKAVK